MTTKSQSQKGKENPRQQRPKQPNTQGLNPQREQPKLTATLQRAQSAPGSLTPGEVLQLQGMVGNQAVGKLLVRRTQPQGIQRKKTDLPDYSIAGIQTFYGGRKNEVIQRRTIRPSPKLRAWVPLQEVYDTTIMTRRQLNELDELLSQKVNDVERQFPSIIDRQEQQELISNVTFEITEALISGEFIRWDTENLGGLGPEAVRLMMTNLVPEVQQFFDWSASMDIDVVFAGGGQVGGEAGETYLQASLEGGWMTIDDPATFFTGWEEVHQYTPLRFYIRLLKENEPRILADAIHEYIVHAMRYKNFIESVRKGKEGDAPLLFHYFLDRGDLSGAQHHQVHGSRAGKETINTSAGSLPASGYGAFNSQIEHMVKKLREAGKENEAQALVKAAGTDVNMQSRNQGNLFALPMQANNSIGLITVYLLNRKEVPLAQQPSCQKVLASLDKNWLQAIDAYCKYKVENKEAPFTKLAIKNPSQCYARLHNKGNEENINSWLKFAPENVLEVLLEYLAQTGGVSLMPPEPQSPTLGNKAALVGVESSSGKKEKNQDGPVTTEQIVTELIPQIKTNLAARSYIRFRGQLAVAQGEAPEPWIKLDQQVRVLLDT